MRISEYLFFWPTIAFTIFVASDMIVDSKAVRQNGAYALVINTCLMFTYMFTLLVLVLSMFEM